jgi:hypothetical protein
MKNRYIIHLLALFAAVLIGETGWGQTDSSLTQVLCFGTNGQPYCVDCSANAGSGLGGSTYYWQITTAGFSGILHDGELVGDVTKSGGNGPDLNGTFTVAWQSDSRAVGHTLVCGRRYPLSIWTRD